MTSEMTLEQFVDRLREKTRATKTQWHIRNNRAIRVKGSGEICHCPLSFVADVTPCAVGLSIIALQMPANLAYEIAYAADRSTINPYVISTISEQRAVIRRKLLDAVELE